MKKIIAILTLALILPGCVIPAVIAGAAAGGAIIYDKRSFKTMGEDQEAYRYATRWMEQDKMLKGRSHITIAVFNNVALLVGQAQTPAIRRRAYEIAKRTKYIKRIYNEITISGPTSTLQRTSDSWITSKVRTALLAKPGLNSNNIKAVTEDGIVYLMGNISRSQAKLAADAARRVKGVRKVVKVFTYD